MWIKTDANFTDRAHLFYISSVTGGNGLGAEQELHVNFNTNEQLHFYVKDAANGADDINITSASSYADNAWHHVVATWDINGNAVIYVDGTSVGSAVHDAANFASSAVTRLGRPSANERYFEGLMDNVRLYDGALSAAQVQDLFNEGGSASAASAAEWSNTVASESLDVAFATLVREEPPNSASMFNYYSPPRSTQRAAATFGENDVVDGVTDDSNLIEAILAHRTQQEQSRYRLRHRDTRNKGVFDSNEANTNTIGADRWAQAT